MNKKHVVTKWMILLSAMLGLLFAATITCYAEISSKTLGLNAGWLESTLEKGTDQYYSFTLPSDGKVELQYQSEINGSVWHLYTEDNLQNAIFSDSVYDGSASSPKTEIRKYDLSKGKYYILIESNIFTGDGGLYRLKVSFTSGGSNDKEPNDTFAEAMTLKKGTQVTGMLTVTDKTDFYKIHVDKTGEVTITLSSDSEDWLYPIRVTLYSKDYIEEDEFSVRQDTPPTTTKRHTCNLKAGDYYIKVSGDTGRNDRNTGVYRLSYSISAVTSVTLNKKSLTLELGNEYQLNATVKPKNAANKTLKWSSSDSKIVWVDDETGRIQAKGCGKAKITAKATDGTGKSATCTVTVVPEKVYSVRSTKETPSSITLEWSSVDDAKGYRVYQYNSKTKKWVAYKDTTKTKLKVSKLSAEKKYKFKVAAYTKIGSKKVLGAKSATFSAYTAPKKLSAPKITVKKTIYIGNYGRTLKITWSKVKGATGYYVYSRTSTGKYSICETTSNRSVEIYMGKGYTWYYKVAAYRTKNGLTTEGTASKAFKYKS